MTTYKVDKSNALYSRAKSVIPGGIFGHYGSSVRELGPKFFSRSAGACFWDVDGNEYIDFMCAFGPMILGYNHPVVDEAVRDEQRRGHAVSLASPVMVDLAERLVEQVAAADWALFGKNGTDSTNLAAMIARAATGREKIVKVAGGYHGVAAWMRANQPGSIAADSAAVLSVEWNDIAGFEQLIGAHKDEIACFIASPYHHPTLADSEMPADGYWQRIEALCKANGIVLIADDVRTGFRIDLAGSNVAFGFTPDMICFGKAIANGHPLAAVVGADALKTTASEVFYTGTQFYSGAPMAAAVATMRELAAGDAVNRLRETGESLRRGLVDMAKGHGFQLVVSGHPAMPYLRLANVPKATHFAWIDECVRRGAYLLGYHNHFLSTAHTPTHVQRACDIADAAFKALAAGGQGAS